MKVFGALLVVWFLTVVIATGWAVWSLWAVMFWDGSLGRFGIALLSAVSAWCVVWAAEYRVDQYARWQEVRLRRALGDLAAAEAELIVVNAYSDILRGR